MDKEIILRKKLGDLDVSLSSTGEMKLWMSGNSIFLYNLDAVEKFKNLISTMLIKIKEKTDG